MPSPVYLHDGEHKITVSFRKEEDRERFKAHYRKLDALGVQYREERDAAISDLDALEYAVEQHVDRDTMQKIIATKKVRQTDAKGVRDPAGV